MMVDDMTFKLTTLDPPVRLGRRILFAAMVAVAVGIWVAVIRSVASVPVGIVVSAWFVVWCAALLAFVTLTHRGTVSITEEGVIMRRSLGRKHFAWQQILGVRVVELRDDTSPLRLIARMAGVPLESSLVHLRVRVRKGGSHRGSAASGAGMGRVERLFIDVPTAFESEVRSRLSEAT